VLGLGYSEKCPWVGGAVRASRKVGGNCMFPFEGNGEKNSKVESKGVRTRTVSKRLKQGGFFKQEKGEKLAILARVKCEKDQERGWVGTRMSLRLRYVGGGGTRDKGIGAVPITL